MVEGQRDRPDVGDVAVRWSQPTRPLGRVVRISMRYLAGGGYDCETKVATLENGDEYPLDQLWKS